MLTVLAFDISSVSTGYCFLVDGYVSKQNCGRICPNAKKSMGERLTYFAQHLKEIIKKHNPECVVIEDIFKGRNMATYKVLAQFRGVAIQTIYSAIQADPISLMASEARGLLKIKNTKEDAFNHINKKYKLKYTLEEHNDITDAIVLALASEEMEKQGKDEKSIRSARRRKKRKTRRNKKGVSKARPKVSSGSKSRTGRRK